MVDTIEEIGTEVRQEFTATPTSFSEPELPPCIVGPLMEIVDAVDDTGALNPLAQPMGPALVEFTDDGGTTYSGLAGAVLELSVDGGAPVSVTFPNATHKVGEVIRVIQSGKIPGLVVELVTLVNGNKTVRLRTAKEGSTASIRIGELTDTAAATAFGLTIGWTYVGIDSTHTTGRSIVLNRYSLPDPNSRLDVVDIKWDTVDIYLSDGTGSLRLLSRDSARFRTHTNAASVVDDGDGDTTSPIIHTGGDTQTIGASPVVVTGNADLTAVDYAGDVQGNTLILSFNGGAPQSIKFSASVTDSTTFLAAINDVFPGVAALSGNFLELTAPGFGGAQAAVEVNAGSSVDLTIIGLTAGTTAGANSLNAYKPVVGDEVWNGTTGTLLGIITEISPGGVDTNVRLDRELPLSTALGSYIYFVGKGLDSVATATRPAAEVRVVGTGDSTTLVVDPFLLFGATGVPAPGTVQVYVSYEALRLDFSPAAAAATTIKVGDPITLAAEYGPLDTRNPLGFGLWCAMRAAPDLLIQGFGVAEITDSEPEGTTAAYAAALEVLENKDVYFVSVLTHSDAVHALLDAHVTAMSEPELKAERTGIVNPNRPDRLTDKLVASGNDGNVLTVPSNVVETGISTLDTLIQKEGLTPSALTESDGVFVEFESDPNRYLVKSIVGGSITFEDASLSFDNDFFYDGEGSPVITEQVIARPWSLKVKGGEITNRTDEAVAYSDKARLYLNRRLVVTAPDRLATPIDGVEFIVPGYYAAAALTGQLAAKRPEKPLSHETLPGFTRVYGSSEYFGKAQLKILSGGGLWVFEQESATAPIRTRHQLTSDMTNVKTREFNITTQVDFTAKYLRRAVRNLTGRNTITGTVLDQVSVALEGARDYLINTVKVHNSLTIGELIQDETNLDTLTLEVEVGVKYPFNYLKITLFI